MEKQTLDSVGLPSRQWKKTRQEGGQSWRLRVLVHDAFFGKSRPSMNQIVRLNDLLSVLKLQTEESILGPAYCLLSLPGNRGEHGDGVERAPL